MGVQSGSSTEPIHVDSGVLSQTNNIGLLRSVFATLVLFSHCFPLTQGSDQSEPLFARTRCMSLGMLAVNCFFLLSGYLIALSWLRRPDAGDFLMKRILRIYPGYVAALVFSAIVGFIGSGQNSSSYCQSLFHKSDRLIQSLLFLEGGAIDNEFAFPGNPNPHIVNGSLWTLLPEMKCYLLVLFLGLFHLLFRRTLLIALTASAVVMYLVDAIAFGNLEFSNWRLFTCFLIGVNVATADRDRLIANLRNPLLFLLALAVLAALSSLPVFFLFALPFLGSYVVLAVAFARPTIGAAFFKRFDLSYGIYLYAFPVQQLIVSKFGVKAPLELFAYSLPVTLVLAFLSWHFIEAPFLRRKPGSRIHEMTANS